MAIGNGLRQLDNKINVIELSDGSTEMANV